MSKNINSERITFLLYLDDPIQSEIIDYVIDLSPSRKGEVLREIISMGWEKFNKDKLSKAKSIRRKKTINKIEEMKEEKIISSNNINIEKNEENFINNNDNNIKSDNDSIEKHHKEEININNKNVETNENKDEIDKINPLASFKQQFGV